MPRRRKKTTRYKRRRRRTYRRRTRRRRGRRPITTTLYPKTKLVRMKYQTMLTLDAAASPALVYHRYRLNSAFDPDYDSVVTDSSFRSFDQTMALYNRYTVLSTRFYARPFGPGIRNNSNEEACNYGITVFPKGEPALLTGKTFNDMRESRLGPTRSGWLHFYNEGNKGLSITVSMKKHFNVQKAGLMCEEGFSGGPSTNPGSNHTAIIGVWACSPTEADLDPITFTVEMDSYVLLTEPKYLGPSF